VDLPSFPIDGNWVDVGSLMTGFVHAIYRHAVRARKARLVSRTTGLDFATGIALFPMVLLTFSVISSALVNSVLQASKISLSIAGFIALLAILENESARDAIRSGGETASK